MFYFYNHTDTLVSIKHGYFKSKMFHSQWKIFSANYFWCFSTWNGPIFLDQFGINFPDLFRKYFRYQFGLVWKIFPRPVWISSESISQTSFENFAGPFGPIWKIFPRPRWISLKNFELDWKSFSEPIWNRLGRFED